MFSEGCLKHSPSPPLPLCMLVFCSDAFMRIFFYTTFALISFAFNSILCRMALGRDEIDAVGFTSIRLFAGAVTLSVISSLIGKTKKVWENGQWSSAFFLFAYAICFSFAYLGLTTGTGALILFGSVQLTMVAAAVIKGERPRPLELVGMVAAFAGLVYLVLPGLASPPLTSSLLMAAAGAAWGFYSLRGRGSTDPLADTTGNFIRAVPMVIVAAIPFISTVRSSSRGVLLAIVSGAIASGVGYSVWYAVLRHHSATRAALLQLAVPIIAAVAGVMILAETAGMRLMIASVLVLGGILLAIFGRQVKSPAKTIKI